jgi:hypothetical protein
MSAAGPDNGTGGGTGSAFGGPEDFENDFGITAAGSIVVTSFFTASFFSSVGAAAPASSEAFSPSPGLFPFCSSAAAELPLAFSVDTASALLVFSTSLFAGTASLPSSTGWLASFSCSLALSSTLSAFVLAPPDAAAAAAAKAAEGTAGGLADAGSGGDKPEAGATGGAFAEALSSALALDTAAPAAKSAPALDTAAPAAKPADRPAPPAAFVSIVISIPPGDDLAVMPPKPESIFGAAIIFALKLACDCQSG